MTSEKWVLHGWRIRYFNREFCFLPSWDFHRLARSEAEPPELVCTSDAKHAIRQDSASPHWSHESLLKDLYLAVTHHFGLPSFSPRKLKEHVLSEVLHVLDDGRLVAVEVEPTCPPTYVAELEAPPPPPVPSEEAFSVRFVPK